jgi:hypothetical protein
LICNAVLECCSDLDEHLLGQLLRLDSAILLCFQWTRVVN